MVKTLPAIQRIQVRSLDQEDPLEEKMATHSSILAWEILWTEEPSGLQSMGHKESDTTEQLNHHHLCHFSTSHFPNEANPSLSCSGVMMGSWNQRK